MRTKTKWRDHKKDQIIFEGLKRIFEHHLRQYDNTAVFRVFRKKRPTGKRVKIAPGLLGEFVEWIPDIRKSEGGDAIATVDMKLFEKFINKHESKYR